LARRGRTSASPSRLSRNRNRFAAAALTDCRCPGEGSSSGQRARQAVMAQDERNRSLSTEANEIAPGRFSPPATRSVQSTDSVSRRVTECWRDVSLSPPTAPTRQVRDSTRRPLGLRYPAGTSRGPAAQGRPVKLQLRITVTPISRSRSSSAAEHFFGSPSCQNFCNASFSSCVRTASVSSVDGCVRMTDRARHPSGSSVGPTGASPWRHGRPRRTLVPPRIQKNFTEPWLPACRRQSPDGLRFGRSAITAAGDGDPASNSVQVVVAPVTVRGSPDRRRPSGKAARYVERLALLQDVIAGTRQLVR
jgi:hypothetical protein